MKYQGKYPVIYLTFKDVKEATFEKCFDKIKDMIQKLFNEYDFLIEKENLTRFEKNKFEKILFDEANQAQYEDSIRFLSELLSNYHNLILGLVFGLESQYVIHSNREYGTGRVDLLLKSKNGKLPNYIFEFKVSNKKVELKKLAQEALEQIEIKKYDFEIENPVKIGMAFYKKEFEMVYID